MARSVDIPVGVFAERLRLSMWALRVLWATLLLSPMILYVGATRITDYFSQWIAERPTEIRWVNEAPWGAWMVAAALAIGSVVIPRAIDRHAVARLRRTIPLVVDDSRPLGYRDAPAMVPQLSDGLIRAVFARYAGRLLLSFGMLGVIVLLAVLGTGSHVEECGLGYCHRYFWRPVDYMPMVALASLLVGVQMPTTRRMLGILRG